jgi:ankyrin repeat protein
MIQDIQQLLAENPDLLNARNKEGLAPLHIAASKNYLRVVRLLLDQGADIEYRTTGPSARNLTPLHIAASHGYKAMTELLLDHGAEINARGAIHLPEDYFRLHIPVEPPIAGRPPGRSFLLPTNIGAG